ncbi:unnamed protein product [Phyllotreta striolata]|uniref:Uncharacterized protein n=1 Tax=Phyllotreta striolata TaxID=444603 RepID=A0A9P0GUW2_PHYSR|nr:unnamed protein product [Phyllotreta striolata]
MLAFKGVLLVGLLSFSFAAYLDDKINVDVYFEALDAGCQDFVVNQLYPGTVNINDVITLNLIPLGKAYSFKNDSGVQWICENGPSECYLNKVYACITTFQLTQVQKLSYISCVASASSKSNSPDEIKALVKTCADKNNIQAADLDTCVTSKGDDLLAGFENRQNSLNPKLLFVPTIRFNNDENTAVEIDSRTNFTIAVCESFSVWPPDVCLQFLDH